VSHDGVVDRALAAAFRQRVLAGIQADLSREQAEESALRTAVTAATATVIAEARTRGSCGRAWLFGSFAWGRPEPRSDVDLLVEGCSDPDALAADVWTVINRPVHIVQLEKAPRSLAERVHRDGKAL
jgi:predicted nucleotidyltransferase